MRKCKHEVIVTTFGTAEAYLGEDHGATSRQCSKSFGCGATLSLGASNDGSETVQIEIRAAELRSLSEAKIAERWGWEDHSDGADGDASDMQSGYVSGYLAAEMATHDDRETRDAMAWPWDPTRPIAGQYEKWFDRIADGIAAEIAKPSSVAEQIEPHPDTLDQPLRSWPPNTGTPGMATDDEIISEIAASPPREPIVQHAESLFGPVLPPDPDDVCLIDSLPEPVSIDDLFDKSGGE